MSSQFARETRQLNTRKRGLMKKASDLQRLCGGIRIAIIIEKNGKVDTFRTEDGFLSSLNIQNANEFRPKDFMTAREAEVQEESERERKSTSSDLEVLEGGLFVPDTPQNLDLKSIYDAGSSLPFEQESISAESRLQESLINDVDESLLDLQWGNMDQSEQSRRWQPARTRHGKPNNPGRIQKVQVATGQTLQRRMVARQQAMSGGRDC
ncbi:hypothetical protein V495_01369 [Pseudogymnoascus sp. VKM F-4514 (FW-929)]|nr:hypothetical protein V495_01369 [Pseudogymnoascus sp. VKM F-4514 (FW-929)]KFY67524.1 hypothetical protein V497_00303 [Pseudogymnoascus sp. VKM F-4516 (FW-969)]